MYFRIRMNCCYLVLILLLGFNQLAVAFDFVGNDLKGAPCTGLVQAYGPYDYTDSRFKKNLDLVDSGHFQPNVASLTKPRQGSFAADLDYTLRAIPNHHRALYTLIRLATEPKPARDPYKWFRDPVHPPECYLQRAIAFSKKDYVPKFLYGLYLHKMGRLKDAEEWYKETLKGLPEYAEAHYNLGLLLLELGRYPEAADQAHAAYRLGYPLQGLSRRLKEAGYPAD